MNIDAKELDALLQAEYEKGAQLKDEEWMNKIQTLITYFNNVMNLSSSMKEVSEAQAILPILKLLIGEK